MKYKYIELFINSLLIESDAIQKIFHLNKHLFSYKKFSRTLFDGVLIDWCFDIEIYLIFWWPWTGQNSNWFSKKKNAFDWTEDIDYTTSFLVLKVIEHGIYTQSSYNELWMQDWVSYQSERETI